MIKNKLIWIFLVLILLPNIIFLGSTPLEKYSNIFRYTDHKGIFLFILFIPIVGSLLMIWYSIKYKNNWVKVISFILLLICVLFWLMVYILSNFGF